MKIGYARVSTNDQDTQLQLDALNSVGCGRIYEEAQSGAKKDRPELQQCLKSLRAGDNWSSGNWTGWAAACSI